MKSLTLKHLLVALLFVLTASVLSYNATAATLCVPGPNTDGLTVNHVTFRGHAADNCYGFSGDNENAGGGLWTVNTLPVFDGGWLKRNKDDEAGATQFLGLYWDLTSAVGGSTSGTWTLAVSEGPGAGTFPVLVDLLVLVKGGNRWAAFLFADETFGAAGSSNGTYEQIFFNRNQVAQDYSHMSIYLRGNNLPPPCSVSDCGSNEAPEPHALAFLGLGLAAVGVLRRRRRSH